jgi:hypothetical protein
MKKQTALEWLEDNMYSLKIPAIYFVDLIDLVNQAKAMEKKQIIEAHGLKREHHIQQGVDYWITKCGLEYYDQTYGGDK